MSRFKDATIIMRDGSSIDVRLCVTTTKALITDVDRSRIRECIEAISAHRCDPHRTARHNRLIRRSTPTEGDDQ